MIAAVVLLTTVGTAANLVIYQVAQTPESPLAKVARRFDLGHEPSLPALYSSAMLAFAGALLLVNGEVDRRSASRDAGKWFALGAVFFLLALDESLMFHEMVDTAIHGRLGTTGVFYFAWVIPAIGLLGGLLVFLGGFLRRLDARTRRGCLLSGFLFVGGAVGMEMVAGPVVETHGVESILHTLVQYIEEGAEMFGVALFIYVLLDRLERSGFSLRVVMGRPDTAPSELERDHVRTRRELDKHLQEVASLPLDRGLV